jgi:hypothetical protein
MSLQSKIRVLIAGIEDMNSRINVASTISYLYDLYSNGRISEEQVRDDLYDVLFEVMRFLKPNLVEDALKKVTEDLVEDFVRTFKLESASKRVMAKYRAGSGLAF